MTPKEQTGQETGFAIASLAIGVLSLLLTALTFLVNLSFFRRVVGVGAALALLLAAVVSWRLRRKAKAPSDGGEVVDTVALFWENAPWSLVGGAVLAVVFLACSLVFLFPEPVENSRFVQARLGAWGVITPQAPGRAPTLAPPPATSPSTSGPLPTVPPTSVPSSVFDDANGEALKGGPVRVYHPSFFTPDLPGYWHIDDLEALRKALAGTEADDIWDLGHDWWVEHIWALAEASPSASAQLSFNIANEQGVQQANLDRILFEVERDPVAPVEDLWMGTPGLGAGIYRGYSVTIAYDGSAHAPRVQTFAAVPGEDEGFDFITLAPGEQESIVVDLDLSMPGLYHITPRALIRYQDEAFEIALEQGHFLVPEQYRIWGLQEGRLAASPIVVERSTGQLVYDGEISPADPPILFASSMVNAISHRVFVVDGVSLTSPIDVERWQSGFDEIRWSEDGRQVLLHCAGPAPPWCAVDLATGERTEIGPDAPALRARPTPGPAELEMGAAAAEAVQADIGAESGMCAAEAWSPSGQKVAVVCWFGTDRDTGYSYRDRGEAELWVADGSGGIRRISPERGIYVDPVWSQDEQQLLVCGDALRVFDTATMAPPNTILEIPLGTCYNATWRPR